MSISTNKARRTGKNFNQVIEDLAEGKTSANITTVDTANKSNKDNGGYVGLQVQTANKQTDTSIFTMKGEMKVGLLSKDGTLSALGKEANTQLSAKKAKFEAENMAKLLSSDGNVSVDSEGNLNTNNYKPKLGVERAILMGRRRRE